MTVIDKLAWVRLVDSRLLVTRSRGQRAFYLPGGKRQEGESDAEALIREVREELGAEIDPSGVRHVLTHEAEAHGKPGTIVRMTCCEAPYAGHVAPASEIEEITWVTAADGEILSDAAAGVVGELAARGLVRTENPPVRAVIFDLDDTLVNTREIKWQLHREVARRFYGIELTDEALAEAWGMPFTAMLSQLYQQAKPEEELVADHRTIAHEYPKGEIPGAVDAVTRILDAGLEVAVVTSTNTDFAVDDLTRLGFPVRRLLDVQGAERSSVHKPDGRVFAEILDRLGERGIGPAEALYVGDSPLDREAALSAGLGFIGVESTLEQHAAPEGHRPPVLTSVVDLPSVILP